MLACLLVDCLVCAEETPADGDSKGDSKADGKGTGLEATASGGDGDGSDAKEGAGEDDDSVRLRTCAFDVRVWLRFVRC